MKNYLLSTNKPLYKVTDLQRLFPNTWQQEINQLYSEGLIRLRPGINTTNNKTAIVELLSIL